MTQNSVPVPSRWSPRQVILATVFIVSVALAFWLLYRFRTVILILFVAIVVGTAIKPAVDWLGRRGLPRAVGEALLYLLLLAALVGFLLVAVPMILEQSTAVIRLVAGYYHDLRELMLNSPSRVIQSLGWRLPFSLQTEMLVEASSGAGQPPLEELPAADRVAAVFRYANLGARGLFSAVSILLMAFYWTLEGDRAIRTLLLLIPFENRERAREMVEAIQGRLGGYLLGQGLLCAVIGAVSLVAYLLIGLPNALVLAFIAGVMEAVPMVGPVLGVLPALLIAAASDPSKIIWVLVAGGIIQLLENNLLVPRVMDRSVGVNPLLTLLSLAALSSLMGLAGALLAIPLAAILQLVFDRLVLNPDDSNHAKAEGRDYLSYLRLQAQEIAQDVRKQVRQKGETADQSSDQLEDAVEELANSLDRILEQAVVERPVGSERGKP